MAHKNWQRQQRLGVRRATEFVHWIKMTSGKYPYMAKSVIKIKTMVVTLHLFQFADTKKWGAIADIHNAIKPYLGKEGSYTLGVNFDTLNEAETALMNWLLKVKGKVL